MSFISFAVLPVGKYLLRKALERLSQVVNKLGFSFCRQSLAQSLSEKGKSLSCMAPVDTPLNLIDAHHTNVSLHKGNEGGVELEIVGLHRRADNI